jgi:glycosyltransferase involved in cell wall biosynthesis
MNSETPQVSLIVPVYNVEAYLPQCLDSICAQTLADIEIICVNDGSPDNCGDILEAYAKKDARIRVFHQENQGLFGARNTGLAQVTGQYVTFVDSDDWIEPETCEAAVSVMRTDPEIDMVCWEYRRLVTRQGELQPDKKASSASSRESRRRLGKRRIMDGNFDYGANVVWNKLFRTEIIRRYQINFPPSRVHEDVAFFGKYCLSSDYIYFLDDCYYNYRVAREGSVVTAAKKKLPPIDLNVQPTFVDIYAHALRWNLLEDRRLLLSAMLARLLRVGLKFSGDRSAFLKMMKPFVEQYNLPDTPAHTFRYLSDGSDFVRFQPLSRLEKLVSVVNENEQNKKIFRILGLEFAVDKH